MVLDRIAFSVFGLDVYWYGITYVVGFIFSYYFILKFSKKFGFEKEMIEDIFLWVIIVSVIFGRIFHIIFYDPIFYLNNLGEIFRFDKGGMSIHGGFFGAFLVLFYYSKKYNLNVLKLTDLFILPAGFGLALGRLANFVNQELVGKVTSSNLGIVFLNVDNNLRWPTTIFESIKNMFVFQVGIYLFFIKNINKNPGVLTGWFLVLYNFLRFFIDFFRVPDVLFGFISMGQILSLIYGFIGVYLLVKYSKK